MVEANIVSYWSCSKFCRAVNNYILAVLRKAKFQVVYHTLILLFWRLLFQAFFFLAALWKTKFQVLYHTPYSSYQYCFVSHTLQLLSILFCITHLTALINTVLYHTPYSSYQYCFVSHTLQLLSTLFWVFWIQLNTWRYVHNRRQVYSVDY